MTSVMHKETDTEVTDCRTNSFVVSTTTQLRKPKDSNDTKLVENLSFVTESCIPTNALIVYHILV
jgi:hypothetical protein